MKYQITSFIFCFLLSYNLFAQPANDDCITAIPLGEAPLCDLTQSYTNVDATESVVNPDIPPACFNGGVTDRDVWFTFSTPADGSIVDFEIIVSGTEANGIIMPQISLYRAEDCSEIQELACVSAEINATEVSLEVLGLSPNTIYWIRVNDYTATGTPNWGEFNICVLEDFPEFIMGEDQSAGVCIGTLYDSGGSDNPYGSNENSSFTICPNQFYQCLLIDVTAFDLEEGDDYIRFFAGQDTNAPQIGVATGVGTGYQLQSSTCVTVQFQSDGSVQASGFVLEWTCSSDVCTQEISSCQDPTVVAQLPYDATDLTTCLAGNTLETSPCGGAGFISGDDYIFTYNSPGNECLQITLSGENSGTGVLIVDDCPNNATDCLGFDTTDGQIESTYLEEAGTYYIVVANANSCTPFDIQIDTVTCPIVFPAASNCDEALSLNGCNSENGVPAVISVAPGLGDPYFIDPPFNEGCIGGGPLNYTFFYFQATSNGPFGFTLFAQNPDEASDIDFSVWGPYTTFQMLCDSAALTQPIRSSYAAGADPTGLANIHPVTGVPITDEYDCLGTNDDFVSMIDVQEGEYYLVWINDWGDNIVSGNMSIDFGDSGPDVLNVVETEDEINLDTVICAGEMIEIIAPEGTSYQWETHPTLNCGDCISQSAIASPLVPTTYQVTVTDICVTQVLSITVDIYNADAGGDVEVCQNEDFMFNVGSSYALAEFQWTALSGTTDWLSCTDCGNPLVDIPDAGNFEFIVEIITPNCSLTDTVSVLVFDAPAPQITIAADTVICAGASVELGNEPVPGVFYSWTSNPLGLLTPNSNPIVTPDVTTIYYVGYSNLACPFLSVDSVWVEVVPYPVIEPINDTVVCQNEPLVLGFTEIEEDVIYSWSPEDNIEDPTDPNSVISPQTTTELVLSATRSVCEITDTINLDVTEIFIDVLNEDSLTYCKGDTIFLNSTVAPDDLEVTWSPNDGSLSSVTGINVTALPDIATTYYAQVSVLGCFKIDSVYVEIDSIPLNMDIMPLDTTICEGDFVTLASTIFDPIDFPEIEFEWTPQAGQQTSDSLFNMVVQPSETTTYIRDATNGVCSAVDTARVTVIPVNYLEVIPNPAEICTGDSIQLDATTPDVTGYEWMPETGLSCIDCPNPIASPTGTTPYVVTGEFMGCPVMGDAIVTVPVPVYLFPDPSICLGESLTLNLSPDPATTYTWTSTDPNFGTSNDPAPTVSPTVETTYYLTAESGSIPCIVEDSITVIVFPGETVSISPQDMTVCTGATINFEANVSGGTGDFYWNNEQIASGPSLELILTETVNINVEYSYGDNCLATDEVTITVLNDPNPNVVFPTDTELCLGESTILNSNLQSFVTYTWTSTDPAFSSSDALPSVTPNETTTYYVNAESGPCGVVEDSVTIVVYPVENVTIDPQDVTLCNGEPLTFEANSDGEGSGSYQWTYDATTTTGQSIDTDFTQTTDLSVLYNYGEDCQATDTIIVTVLDDPLPNIVFPTDTTLCLGESVLLNSNPQSFVDYVWTADPSDPTLLSTNAAPLVSPTERTTYSLVASNGECSIDYNITIEVADATISTDPSAIVISTGEIETITTSVSGTQGGSYIWDNGDATPNTTITGPYGQDSLRVIYSYSDGCIDTAYVQVLNIPSYAVPTVFTPGSSSPNNTFRVFVQGEEEEPTGIIEIESFLVFNRWGQVVFESTNPDTAKGWDGNFKDTNTPAPADVYVFVIKLLEDGNPADRALQGEVTLIR